MGSRQIEHEQARSRKALRVTARDLNDRFYGILAAVRNLFRHRKLMMKVVIRRVRCSFQAWGCGDPNDFPSLARPVVSRKSPAMHPSNHATLDKVDALFALKWRLIGKTLWLDRNATKA
jgi:hypothetical protein